MSSVAKACWFYLFFIAYIVFCDIVFGRNEIINYLMGIVR